MRNAIPIASVLAFFCLTLQREGNREALGTPPPSISTPSRSPISPAEKLLASDTDLDPPTPPGPQEKATGLQKILHGSNRRLHDCSVVEVTLNSITVFYKGSAGWSIHPVDGEIVMENGKLIKGERKWETTPSRRIRFPAGKELSNGGFSDFSIGFGRDASYPLAAVEVGDRVSLEINVENSRYVCTGICIWRRPGGRVPKAPMDHDPDDFPHHYEGANALQALEEKGIPLPEKYSYLNGNGTLPKHLQGMVAYPGIPAAIRPTMKPVMHTMRRLFR